MLFLEVKKFEGLHRFMDLERDLIMKAQKDAEGLNPAVSPLDVEQFSFFLINMRGFVSHSVE